LINQLKAKKRRRKMVDIIPSSQLVIGHGAFSIVYRAKLKSVSSKTILHRLKSSKNEKCKFQKSLYYLTTGKTKKSSVEENIVQCTYIYGLASKSVLSLFYN